MADDTPGRVAATLSPIRERFETVTGIPLEALPLEPEQAAAFAALVMDIPSLVAAVEDVLKLAGDWDAEAARLDIKADQADRTVPRVRNASALMSARAQALEGCARELRAITAALTGEEAGDGRH